MQEQNLTGLLDQITELVEATREDAIKFDEKGNGAAGTRVRKAMQTLKALAQETRTHVSESKKV